MYLDDPKVFFPPEESDENFSPQGGRGDEEKVAAEDEEEVAAEAPEEDEEEAAAEGEEGEEEADEENEESAEEKVSRKSYKKMMIAKGSLSTRYADRSSMKKTSKGYKYKKMSDAARLRPQASYIRKFREAYKLALTSGKIEKSPSGKIPKKGTHNHTIIKGLMEITCL